ncbi:MAG: glycosyltransferase family 4 protein [Methylococcaceae bacterium]|nr:glycosyltransferase family 4 protein [Methylococcaceae bacterium]
MKVGVVVTHVPPALGYGGVAVTAGILTRAWASQGHRVTVVASDESIAGRLQPQDVEMGAGNEIRLYRSQLFRRWGFGVGAIPAILRLCRESDAIYIHGIATWPCTLAGLFCAALGKRFAVALHGGLMPEHVELIRARKPHKWLYYRMFTFPALRRAVAIHCTSATETAGARAVLGADCPVLQVPNGVEYRHLEVAPVPAGPGLKVCFLGHIQQEKGINGFLRAWIKVRRPQDRLVVAGRSVDAEYFREFQYLLGQAGGSVEYRGYLPKDEVNRLLADSHFLALPSGLEECGGMRENFGNVVAEAMALGRPVLVARGLAWDRVEATRTGFRFERSEESASAALQRAQQLTPEQWYELSRRARGYVEHQLDPVRLGNKVWEALAAGSVAPVEATLTAGIRSVSMIREFTRPTTTSRHGETLEDAGVGFSTALRKEFHPHD